MAIHHLTHRHLPLRTLDLLRQIKPDFYLGNWEAKSACIKSALKLTLVDLHILEAESDQ